MKKKTLFCWHTHCQSDWFGESAEQKRRQRDGGIDAVGRCWHRQQQKKTKKKKAIECNMQWQRIRFSICTFSIKKITIEFSVRLTSILRRNGMHFVDTNKKLLFSSYKFYFFFYDDQVHSLKNERKRKMTKKDITLNRKFVIFFSFFCAPSLVFLFLSLPSSVVCYCFLQISFSFSF